MRYRFILLLACIVLIVAPLGFLGGRMVYRAQKMAGEEMIPAVPLEGPYTEEELRYARGQLARVMPPDEFLKGVSREQLESSAEATRALERARRQSWDAERPQRAALAARRRRTGWVLVGLAALLLAAWGALAWSVGAKWRGQSTVL